MTGPRYLTKSRFKIAVECPTKLFYTGKRTEYADSMEGNEFLAMLAEGGYQVGALAKLRYPEGIEIREKSHADAEAETRDYLSRDRIVLFEPAIRCGNFFIRIDILVKKGRNFELIEVKAKSYDSTNPDFYNKSGSIKPGVLPYFQDAAFQTWVLQQAYPDATITTSLMMPDKSQTAPVDGINQMFRFTPDGEVCVQMPVAVDGELLAKTLLAKINISSDIANILKNKIRFPGGAALIGQVAITWAQAYSTDQRIAPAIGRHCKSCQFRTEAAGHLKSGFHECWKAANNWQDTDFSDGLVLYLANCKKIPALIDHGVYKLSQVKKEDLGEFDEKVGAQGLTHIQRQWFQANGLPEEYRSKGYYLDEALFRKERAQWRFPYHFIDFETAAVALPFYAGMRPYEQIAFQFSHHVMTADGKISHVGEFLCVTPGDFPNFKFARALMDELENDDGTVFMWSHHENTILSRISVQIRSDPNPPADIDEIQAFLGTVTKGGKRAMVDLCALASKAYFHPDTKGSSSIKKVLPAILKSTPLLQSTYSQPIYGAPDGIKSLNFASPNGFAWIDIGNNGEVSDPYAKLKQAAKDLLPDDYEDTEEGGTSVIAEGGAAATAYARLQFEELDNNARNRIESALLRYCELDTLAMAMIMESWIYYCSDN